ncbi:MAG TPA: hypothetical protein VFB43_09370 [Terracidiphilus sp.]|nr:hypothetical protein [Terracidiphilus sp.]
MRSSVRLVLAIAGFSVLMLSGLPIVQGQPLPVMPSSDATPDEIPDAPAPQTSGGQTSSATQQSDRDKAEQQIKAQEKQRVMGIVPSFNVSYLDNAVSLTAGQKIRLAFRSQIDPYAFGLALIVSGIGEAKDDDPGFGWGPRGYGERAGAAYLDAFDGAMIGNGFLPALLHQDPRYFRLGHGSIPHRMLYAISTSFICKHDHTGKWEPNYSNLGGNIASGAISNLYYPESTGISHTITDGFTVTAEGAFGGVLQEFWPDISRKLFHKDPTNGRDAQMRAADRAKKAEKQQK